MKRRQFLKSFAVITAVGGVVATVGMPLGNAFAASVYKSDDNVAINGYDPVGYFTMGKPVKGSGGHKSQVEGATWLFSSAENKSKFDANPKKYLPKYGGFCAYAMSKGAKAPTDPNAWTIVDNKLYLNYSPVVRGIWKKDQAENIKKADLNWPNVR